MAPGASNQQAVPIDYEFEVQAMFPSLFSVAAIGTNNAVSVTANTLNIKTSITFNFKKAQANNNGYAKSVYSLEELPTV